MGRAQWTRNRMIDLDWINITLDVAMRAILLTLINLQSMLSRCLPNLSNFGGIKYLYQIEKNLAILKKKDLKLMADSINQDMAKKKNIFAQSLSGLLKIFPFLGHYNFFVSTLFYGLLFFFTSTLIWAKHFFQF